MPPRPSRRLEYVERALAPLQGALEQDELDRLTHALTVVIGIEPTIVLRDICGLESAEILRVQHWAARAHSLTTRYREQIRPAAFAVQASAVARCVLLTHTTGRRGPHFELGATMAR